MAMVLMIISLAFEVVYLWFLMNFPKCRFMTFYSLAAGGGGEHFLT